MTIYWFQRTFGVPPHKWQDRLILASRFSARKGFYVPRRELTFRQIFAFISPARHDRLASARKQFSYGLNPEERLLKRSPEVLPRSVLVIADWQTPPIRENFCQLLKTPAPPARRRTRTMNLHLPDLCFTQHSEPFTPNSALCPQPFALLSAPVRVLPCRSVSVRAPPPNA
jgi:hypothetical protein